MLLFSDYVWYSFSVQIGRLVYERFLWSQDKTTPVEEESVSAEILAPAPKEPTEAPAPTPAETGISLSTSQGRSLTFPRAFLLSYYN